MVERIDCNKQTSIAVSPLQDLSTDEKVFSISQLFHQKQKSRTFRRLPVLRPEGKRESLVLVRHSKKITGLVDEGKDALHNDRQYPDQESVWACYAKMRWFFSKELFNIPMNIK